MGASRQVEFKDKKEQGPCMEMFCAGPFSLLVEALIFLTTRGALLFQGCDEISITICEHLVIALSVVFDIDNSLVTIIPDKSARG